MGWTSISTGTSETLNGLWGFASNDVWAVGNNGTILHWNGSAWSSSLSGTSEHLQDIWGFASNDVWAVGANGTAVHWNGSTWTVSSLGVAAGALTIWGLAANDIWVGLDSNPTLPFLHWNGSTWTTFGLVSGTANDVSCMWGAASNDIWAGSATDSRFFHWNGTTWSQSTLASFGIQGMWGTSSSDIWASVGFRVSHWNGSVWTETNAPAGNVEALLDVWGATSTDFWFVGTASVHGSTVHLDGSGPRFFPVGVDSLRAVWGYAGNDVWAVGDFGVAFHFDGALPDTLTPVDTGTTKQLADVWGASSDDVWALGYDQTIIHWNGSAWSLSFEQPPETFNKAWGFSTSDTWQVGTNGVIEHWNGSMWLRVSSGVSEELLGVWGFASNDIWAVGRSGRSIHWNGTAWSTVSTGVPEDLFSVWGFASNDVWAVGEYTGSEPIIIHWNGTAWSTVASGLTSATLLGVWGASSTDVWAVGSGGDITHWNGSTWSSVASGTANTLTSVHGTSSTDVWAVGITGTIRHWNGSTWGTSTSGTGNTLTSVFAFTASDVWTISLSPAGSFRYNGTTWSSISANGYGNGLWGAATNDLWAVGSTSTLNGVRPGHWDGSSWFNGNNVLNSVFGLASDDVWAVGNNGMLRHWDGAAWNPISINLADSWKMNFNSVWASSPTDVWVAAGAGSGVGGYIVHWNGSAWSLSTTLVGNDGFAIWGLASNDIWVAGDGFSFAHWNGTSWSLVAKATTGRIHNIWGAASNDVWAVHGGGGVIEHWNGTAWSVAASPNDTFPASFWGFSANNIFSAGYDGTLLYWNGSAWSDTFLASGYGSDLYSIWGVNPTDFWAVGPRAANGVNSVALHFSIPAPVIKLPRPGYFGKSRITYPFQWGIALALPKALYTSGQAQLADGRCLVFGGIDGADFQNLQSDSSYLIAANGLSVTPVGNLPFSVGETRTTLLGDNRVLMVAGGGQTATFDPNTLTWTTRATCPILVSQPCLVTLPNGNALLMNGGTNGVQEYLAGSNTWAGRASQQTLHVGGTATVIPALNEVFISSVQGTGFNNGVVEIYDVLTDTWSFPANTPQTGQYCQVQVLLPNGKLFTSTDGLVVFGRTDADLYDPETRLFSKLPSQSGNTHSSSLYGGGSIRLGFFLGENKVAIFSSSSPPRISWFDVGTHTWFGGGFDSNPDYQTNGESLESPSFVFYLGQAGGTLGFLVGGHYTQFTGYYVPHAGGFYIERSQAPVFDGRLPTFNGVVTVEQGLTADRVFLTWSAGSDTITNERDLNYYGYATQISGGENYGNPGNTTFMWAGALTMELRNLTPGILHYFQVAVRNMRGKNQPDEYFSDGDPQTTSVEATFTPNAPGTPLSSGSWVSAPPMDRPRSGPAGAYLSEGRYLVWGGFDSGNPSQGAPFGNIYSQNGASMLIEYNAPPFLEGAVVDASPKIYGQTFQVLGFHKATSTGGLDNNLSGTVPYTNKYFPYTDFWNQSEGFFGFSIPGDMNQSVYRHAMVQLPGGSLLRMGGMTEVGNVASATNTVEYFHYGTPSLTYMSLVTPFTIGATLVGISSGARGQILTDVASTLTYRPYSDLQFIVGEPIYDTSGGEAIGLFSNVSLSQTWSFRTSMAFKRFQHSAVNLNGYSMRLAGITVAFSVGEIVTGGTSGATGEIAFLIADGSGFAVAELINFDPSTPFSFGGESITGDMGGVGFLNGFDTYKSTKVLVVGGKDDLDNPVLFAEVYDSLADTWSGPIATGDAHYLSPLVMGTNGRPLAIGGGSVVVDSFNPDTNTFTALAPLPDARTEHTAHVFPANGHVGVFGGRSAGFDNTDTLCDVWGANPDDVWAVGFNFDGTRGVIYHYLSGVWTRDEFILDSVTRFHSVYGFATNDVWTVGQAGQAMHWDGATWTDYTIPSGFTLYSVFGESGGLLFAVGLSGKIYKWNGSSWVLQTSPTSETLLDITGTGTHYYAVGFDGVILETTDGTNWSIIQAGLTTETLTSIVRVTSPSLAIWICGWNGALFRSTGGAFSAFPHGTAFTGDWTCVRGVASDDVWLWGNDSSAPIGSVAHFNGSAWTLFKPFGTVHDAVLTRGGLLAFASAGLGRRVWTGGTELWYYEGGTWFSDPAFATIPAGVTDIVMMYDPATNAWTFQNPMLDARARHVSFLMPNNKVLVAGGENNSATSLSSVEISPGPL